MPTATEIAIFADELLGASAIADYDRALNGLQVDTSAKIEKLAAAVDFSSRAVRGARDAGANLLLVHHGAFWGGLVPLTGKRFQVFAELIKSGMGVYSSHLPLDGHPTLGNNALLAEELGLSVSSAFGRVNDAAIGVAGEAEFPLSDLIAKARAFADVYGGRVHVTPHSDAQRVGRWAICTGAGASSDTLKEAEEKGIDTLIVGEGPHWTAVHAEENGMTIIYVGHYASETLGVQALAAEIGKRFGIPWEFIHAPTGT